MSVTSGQGNLRQASKDLRVRWTDTKAAWHDQNSRRFEEKYLVPLLGRLRTVELAMGQMATVLRKVRGDCE